LSQVAVAIHLLNGVDRADKVRAEVLLQSAAAKGYDDAFYWLGASQADKKKSIYYLEKANGSGGMGLMALAVAADIHFKGDGVPKDFKKARAVYKRAFEAMISNANKGIPKPPGEWWSNAKWFDGQNAVVMYSERYGFQVKTIDGKQFLVSVEPHPELSDKELSERRWKKISEVK
jgi:TPR repeat protein